MRLDARKGHRAAVYDAKRCCAVKQVMWVDSATAQWGRAMPGYGFMGDEISIETVQEDRITIYLDKRLVIFNEVDDPEADDACADVALKTGA